MVDSRKILMTAISVFLGNERIFIKTILVVLVCFISFAVQVGAKPLDCSLLSYLEENYFSPSPCDAADEMGAIDQ